MNGAGVVAREIAGEQRKETDRAALMVLFPRGDACPEGLRQGTMGLGGDGDEAIPLVLVGCRSLLDGGLEGTSMNMGVMG